VTKGERKVFAATDLIQNTQQRVEKAVFCVAKDWKNWYNATINQKKEAWHYELFGSKNRERRRGKRGKCAESRQLPQSPDGYFPDE
jgi:hypothetical protein